MAKNGRMQKVMMRVLAVMLVASFLLAVINIAWPRPASAAYTWCQKYFCYHAVMDCRWRTCGWSGGEWKCIWGESCGHYLKPCYQDCPQP
ncbi:MAG: hypothetical protein SXV54_16000 [Chloroflexota bacterium]|nr:hypothetical protein [Chloroflexota bacterium]